MTGKKLAIKVVQFGRFEYRTYINDIEIPQCNTTVEYDLGTHAEARVTLEIRGIGVEFEDRREVKTT